jgi:hypothetical protein
VTYESRTRTSSDLTVREAARLCIEADRKALPHYRLDALIVLDRQAAQHKLTLDEFLSVQRAEIAREDEARRASLVVAIVATAEQAVNSLSHIFGEAESLKTVTPELFTPAAYSKAAEPYIVGVGAVLNQATSIEQLR